MNSQCKRLNCKLDAKLLVARGTEWEPNDFWEFVSSTHDYYLSASFYGSERDVSDVDGDPLFGDEQTAYSDSPRPWD